MGLSGALTCVIVPGAQKVTARAEIARTGRCQTVAVSFLSTGTTSVM